MYEVEVERAHDADRVQDSQGTHSEVGISVDHSQESHLSGS